MVHVCIIFSYLNYCLNFTGKFSLNTYMVNVYGYRICNNSNNNNNNVYRIWVLNSPESLEVTSDVPVKGRLVIELEILVFFGVVGGLTLETRHAYETDFDNLKDTCILMGQIPFPSFTACPFCC